MWTRAELKANAKQVLRRTYWLSFAVTLVAGLISGIGSGGASAINIMLDFEIYVPPELVAGAGLLSLFAAIFVAGPIAVGLCRYFMQSREYDADFSVLFYGFSGVHFWPSVKAMLLRSVYIFAWCLLFFIPGIVKSYEYYFVPYIMAENPELSASRVFQISRDMTRGYKWRIFILELSFLGWYLLGGICFGIGVFFVNPYESATMAELYAAQRAYVLNCGLAGEHELCGFAN